MKILAVLVLVSWALVGGAMIGARGSTKGWHVVVAPVLSILLAFAVLIA